MYKHVYSALDRENQRPTNKSRYALYIQSRCRSFEQKEGARREKERNKRERVNKNKHKERRRDKRMI